MDDRPSVLNRSAKLSQGARAELEAMGIRESEVEPDVPGIERVKGRSTVPKKPISAPGVLNEAYDYAKPSSFSRGMRVDLPAATMLFLSGTASVDDDGRSVHPGDFAAQCLRTFRNLTELLRSEEASWHDVVRTTCYLRDIERDYDEFNDIRTLFMNAIGLDPLPASTGIQARLCRPDLLIEIEAIAIVPHADAD
jgi:enamine deaminase RidA (YjgF/YER057c/UK114 family)